MLRARLLLAPLFLVAAVGLGSPAALAQDKFTLKIATQAPDGTPWATLLQDYKAAVETASKGRITVSVWLGGQKGDENETVRNTGTGSLQGVAASTGALATLVPELNMLEIPFTFRSFGEADWVLDKVLSDPMAKLFRDRGLVLGFWSENGFRHFGSTFPITSPADLAGKKMRSQESKVHTWMWETFGAAFQAIPTTEVLTALTNKNVDGFDQTLLFALAAKWHKPMKVITLSGHVYQPAAVAFNAVWFNKLPADLQKVLLDEGHKLVAGGREAIRAMNKDLIELVKKDNVAIAKLSEDQRKAFAAVIDAKLPEFMAKQTQSSKDIRALILKGIADFKKK